MTKEKITSILEQLSRLGLGNNDGSAVDKGEPMQHDVLFSSVTLASPCQGQPQRSL